MDSLMVPPFLVPALLPMAVAFMVALAVGAAGRLLRRPGLGAVAAAAGLLAGWWWTMGLLTASPRQLPERLPVLAAGLLLLSLGAMAAHARSARMAVAVAGALATGWWMAGAPKTGADAMAALPVLAGVALLALLLLRQPAAWSAPLAALGLLAALVLVRLPGPGMVLAAVVVAAAAGALAAGPLAGMAMAGAMAALASLPVLARGTLVDWAAAAAPVVALWVVVPAGRLAPAASLALSVAGLAAWLGVMWLLR